VDSTALIASVKRRASVPTTQATVTTTDLLTICDEETLSYISPLMRASREDYGISNFELPLTAGVLSYRLPARAMAGVLRKVVAIQTTGQITNLPRIDYAQLAYVDGPGFTLEGNTVFLVISDPALVPSMGTTLRLTYYQRPSSLVLPSAVATVLSVTGATNTVTLTGTPPGTFLTTSRYDFVRQDSPYETLGIDFVASGVGSSMVFTEALPADMRAGDFVCLANQTPVPQIPLELHPLLAQSAAVSVLAAVGDLEGRQAETARLAKMEADARALIAQRVDGEPVRIVNRTTPFRAGWC
jgi:hypothetical protein